MGELMRMKQSEVVITYLKEGLITHGGDGSSGGGNDKGGSLSGPMSGLPTKIPCIKQGCDGVLRTISAGGSPGYQFYYTECNKCGERVQIALTVGRDGSLTLIDVPEAGGDSPHA
jgi:hypothetical protein